MERNSKSNASEKKRMPWRKVKRWLAMTMAALMVATSAMQGTGMVSYAASTPELQPDTTMKGNSAGLTTAYKWGHKGDWPVDHPAPDGRFDLEGIKDASNINKDGGYTGNRNKGVITTYGHLGYETVIKTSKGRQVLQIKDNGGVETNEDQHVDVQMKVYPSPDRKWIFVDYIVCNRLNKDNTVQIASGTDVQVGGTRGSGGNNPADASALVANDVGFHMVNSDLRDSVGNIKARGTQESFDLKYNDPSLGLTPPTTKWVGKYDDKGAKYFTDGPYTVSNVDSELTYSWTINLKPYETQLRRVAFSAKGPSYYVSTANGKDSNTGADNAPLQTIAKAMEKIGNKVGYIYIQDLAPMDQTVTVPSGANITISSADYGFDSQPTSKIVTLTRKSGFTGSMFTTSGGTVKLSDLVVDGENRTGCQPLLSADKGKIGVQSGCVLQNNQVSDSGKASAIDLTGSASLEMNFGEMRGNVSNDRGAVNFNSTGTFTMQNTVTIKDNTLTAGKPANVYLPKGKFISVAGDLGSSDVGVTTEVLPDPTANDDTTKAAQEVKVAAPTAEYVFTGPCPFVDNFKSDNPGIEGAKIYMSGGVASLGASNEKNAVLKKNGFQILFGREVKDTGAAVPAAKPLDSMILGKGDPVSLDLSKADPHDSGVGSNYTRLDEVRIEPEGALAFTPSAVPGGPSIGTLGGSMPGQDVTVTYLYSVADTKISFHPNGGAPTPDPITGKTGSPNTNLLPSVSRYGYNFKGWSQNNDRSHPKWITDESPAWTAFPEGNMDLYAIFEPNPSITFDYTTQYVNEDGSISFQDDTRDKKKTEEEITASYQKIHGYSLDKGETVPDKYNYGSPVPGSSDPVLSGGEPEDIGRFDASHAFKGYMPGQPATVRYRYKVNRLDESAKSTLTVRHVAEGTGTKVAPDETSTWFPEDMITAKPLTRYGYECQKGVVTSGTKENPTLPVISGLLTGVTGEFNSAYEFHGTMPNQNVVITYTYKTTGGYPLTINYMDTAFRNPALQKLPESSLEQVPPDSSVNKAYTEPYGYQLASKDMTPTGGKITWNGNGIQGLMPSDDVTVTYNQERRGDKWADVTFTYDKAEHGKLVRGETTSEDLLNGADGKSFHTSLLINDKTEAGQKNAYTIKQIADKGLSPLPQADDNYVFDGWFADGNGNGALDKGEAFYAKDGADTLEGAVTLTAHFVKDPSKWGDITLKAGNNGSIIKDGAPIDSMTVNVSQDQTWSQIGSQLPQLESSAGEVPKIKPVVNYLTKGWYHGGNPVAQSETLKWGDVYTIEFKKDPAFFGTNSATPEVEAGIDGLGRGKAAVLDAAEGYQYILADSDGKVLAVQNGNSVSLSFGDLQPGSSYQVYEAPAGSFVTAGDDAAHVTGISPACQVLVPVVDTNYHIYYDDNEDGKTVLVIRPADKKSEYALLDEEGNAVHTPQTGQSGWQAAKGSPGSLSFAGLDYNKQYTVVARPAGAGGITPESRKDGGSTITTDPGGEMELPSFVVKTDDSNDENSHDGIIQKVVRKTKDEGGTEIVPGSENVPYFKDTRAGDTVYLKADNESGTFDHWEITIGSVKGLNAAIKSPAFSFEMPETNLVFTAVYKQKGTPSNAKVIDEVREGSPGELALVRSEIPRLEEDLTTDKDRELKSVNHTPVTYRVVYQKTGVKASESNAIRPVSSAYQAHPDSFKEAWGLGVSVERYVGARKVNPATPSDASFKTYVQLGHNDVDMLDYELYDVAPNPGGEPSLVPWLPDDAYNPETTGGLFAFEAQAGHRYVMCYSKAYRVRFKNDVFKNSEGEADYNASFKVRRNESPSDSYYLDDYGRAMDYGQGLDDKFTDSNGLIFTKMGWSYQRDRLVKFDPDRGITRKTTVYMCYKDNSMEVENARQELESYVAKILDMSNDHFLQGNESQELKEFVKTAQAVLDQVTPSKATQEDLLAALARLKQKSSPYEAKLKKRYEDYDHKQEGGSKGGGGSGGGGGGGTKRSPYNDVRTDSYRIGTNGNWMETTDSDGKTARMTFVLNGGMALKDMWARLEYPKDSSAGGNNEAAGTGWYHFDDQGFLESGWLRDLNGTWYYCNTKQEGNYGKMATGWKQESGDTNWYYLDPASGAMATGWKQIDGKWYYFSSVSGGVYTYDPTKGQWVFGGGAGRPLGAMYKNEVTPDGYTVGPDGAWIQ